MGHLHNKITYISCSLVPHNRKDQGKEISPMDYNLYDFAWTITTKH